MIFKLKKLTMKEFGASGNHGALAVQPVVKGQYPDQESATKMESLYLPTILLSVRAIS